MSMQKQDSKSEVSPQVISIESGAGVNGDMFNPERLRISQNFADEVGVRKVLLQIPVCKPQKQQFVRVHSDPGYRLDTLVLELKEDREVYLVDPGLGSQLPGEITAMTLFTAITRQGVVFLWPVRLPDPSGKRNSWPESARKAADLAMSQWIRVAANMSLGGYETFVATGDLPDPDWPTESFPDLLRIAFSDRYIQTMDHPVIKKLRGAL
jgi:hypothetical protein